MYDLIAIGELLFDMVPAGKSDKGNTLFEANPGGAPANVLGVAAKFGRKTAFIGKVGEDAFGQRLAEVLGEYQISTEGLVFSAAPTTLAFVQLDSKGERSFSFYRKQGADVMLNPAEVSRELIKQTKIFHFGSVSLTDEPVRSATFAGVELAKKHQAVISYDPNLRPLLWQDLAVAKDMMLKGLGQADVVKLSEEELLFLTGMDEIPEAAAYLYDQYGLSLILVTLGEKGCYYHSRQAQGRVAGFSVAVVDTTGAGDAFFGGALHKILSIGKDLPDLTTADLKEIVTFGNAVGALVTTAKGALPSIPRLEQVVELIESHREAME